LFFSSGEIYSLFPATSADIFGPDHATTNYGLLYTGKGIASFIVPLGSVITAATGSWMAIFIVVIAFNVITALLALLALKPLRRRIAGDRKRLFAAGVKRIAA
jgi:OFA family oxalate/formate antiporter-like MFS transporter